MSTKQRIAIVTGANKGVGLAAVRQLALKYPTSPLNTGGSLLIYLAARSPERGEEAVQTLLDDAQLREAGVLVQQGGSVTVKFRELDIGSAESVAALGEFLKKEHESGVDVVINNAGIALKGFDSAIVRETIRTNYHGTLDVCTTLLPLLKPSPQSRLVNVASISGMLDAYSPAIQANFHAAVNKGSIPAVTALMEKFQHSVDADRVEEAGFVKRAYGVSKAGVIAFSKVLAEQQRQDGVVVNACCPGYVATSMTEHMDRPGAITPDEGARTLVMLALQDLDGKRGEFWREEKVVEW
ncbi:hypothetical protein BDY17DRAFT_326700 [Neohortaea acidophila]|uniref:Carbonyl reductase n=1 Tax=Neohortaea acidophila TaxID=245834 RepID=A0A6A6PLY0_9PEZI|nr:uncharacterized protein BDY17DRAFT_326700 [Neohortaea acidophila]KAF2480826.1 hypothetical protein BDY17DRAFT_326700 [Neohortaea acidophila]